MVYGSPSEFTVVGALTTTDEFRKVLIDAPAGVFTANAWARWHERLGMTPIPPLPRRRFPDGTFGPEPGTFFGR